MANIIGTERQAHIIGGTSTSYTSNLASTKVRTSTLGCSIRNAGNYSNNQLVRLTDMYRSRKTTCTCYNKCSCDKVTSCNCNTLCSNACACNSVNKTRNGYCNSVGCGCNGQYKCTANGCTATDCGCYQYACYSVTGSSAVTICYVAIPKCVDVGCDCQENKTSTYSCSCHTNCTCNNICDWYCSSNESYPGSSCNSNCGSHSASTV